MKKKLCPALAAFLLLVTLLPVSADSLNIIPAKETKTNGQPYYIMVNRKMSTVTVYGLDENDCYTVPVRAMICSTGSSEHATPRGSYSVGRKHRWRQMLGGVYAQYLTQFYNDCLFHSVCYSKPRSDALLTGYYEALGAPASHGCIRLQTEDAKWIYENCAAGTHVTVYDGPEAGELGKPEKMIPALRKLGSRGWDPTDPAPGNPWADHWTTDISISAERVYLAPGETCVLDVSRLPEDTTYPTVMFASDKPSVSVVDGAGRIRATGSGRASITVNCGDAERFCEIVVSDERLPYRDITPDDWYTGDIVYLFESGLLAEYTGDSFAPDEPVSLREALRLTGFFAGSPAGAALIPARLAVWEETGQFAAAGAPDAALSRREALSLLYRLDALRSDAPGWTGYAAYDANGGDPVAAWAVRTGLLLGGDDDGALFLDENLTRAQLAALLHRYGETLRQ